MSTQRQQYKCVFKLILMVKRNMRLQQPDGAVVQMRLYFAQIVQTLQLAFKPLRAAGRLPRLLCC